MFRLKIALAFVLLISGLVGIVYLTVHSHMGQALEEDAEVALRRTALIAEKTRRLDEFALLEKARFVAQRADLNAAMVAEYEGENGEYDRHMQVHKLLERDQILFTEFYAPKNKGKRNLDLNLLHREPMTQEIFMVIDASGKGVATLGKDLLQWFGDNVAKQHPIILEVMQSGEARTDMWLWSYSAADKKQLYVVSIVPLRASPGEPPVGVVVLGNAINDGVAKSSQLLLEGRIALEKPQHRRDSREQSLAPEIAFFHGNKIYGSTFGTAHQLKLAKVLFEGKTPLADHNLEELIEIQIDDRPYRALARYFPGHAGGETPAGFVVLTDAEQALKPLVQTQSNILFGAAAILLLGLGLLLFFIFQFIKPFEKVEQGIQEMLAGNKEYEFSTEGLHEHAASLSQMLNLLTAYLQGKPMPDDDGSEESWGELMPEAHMAKHDKAGAPIVQGVALPGMGPKAKKEAPTEEDVS
ncbi:MAG: hypothetical protein H0U74_04215 [Bradymonadaceae bacterium]|nr:hypothetical protein [Lujinxingiaceae bacterium]